MTDEIESEEKTDEIMEMSVFLQNLDANKFSTHAEFCKLFISALDAHRNKETLKYIRTLYADIREHAQAAQEGKSSD